MTTQQAKDAPIGSLVLWESGSFYLMYQKAATNLWEIIGSEDPMCVSMWARDDNLVGARHIDVSSDFGLVYDRTQNCMVQAQASQTVTAPTQDVPLTPELAKTLKPGDKVKCLRWGGDTLTAGRVYKLTHKGLETNIPGVCNPCEPEMNHDSFSLVSRVSTHEQSLNVQNSTHDDTAPRCSGDCHKEYIGQHVPGCAYKAYNDKRNAELLGWST